MSGDIAQAICCGFAGIGLGLIVTQYWLHTEHVAWKRIVDKYASIVDGLLAKRQMLEAQVAHLTTMLQSTDDFNAGRTRPIEDVIDDFARADEPVELHQAFSWDCPICGREQFARCITADLPEDEMAEAKQALGVEPWEDGQLVQAPDTVTCRICETRFCVSDQDPNEEEAED